MCSRPRSGAHTHQTLGGAILSTDAHSIGGFGSSPLNRVKGTPTVEL